jgi:hypothetical protein
MVRHKKEKILNDQQAKQYNSEESNVNYSCAINKQ